MKTRTNLRLAASAICIALLSACAAPNTNSAVYSTGQGMQAMQVQFGQILSVRMVELRGIQNGDRAIGAVVGAVVGSLAADDLSDGNAIATGLGSLAGAAAGSAGATAINRTQAQEWTVRLDSGAVMAIVQNDPNMMVGQRVRVINNGTTTRIAP